MKKIKAIEIVKKLTALGERQFGAEKKAAGIIKEILRDHQIGFCFQKFTTIIPVGSGRLLVDGKKVRFRANCFVGGRISSKGTVAIIDNLASNSDEKRPNINYNPKCPEISPADFYRAPSFCVSVRDLPKIKRAKTIDAEVSVKKVRHQSANILVGNAKTPKNILFCHYDSWGPGATDDAAGVAIVLQLVIENPWLSAKNMFVFAGNEEINANRPDYWGRGYRIFEGKYHKQMKAAERLIVIDGIGNTGVRETIKGGIIKLAFPIKNLARWKKKISVFHSPVSELLHVYHSELDVASRLREGKLREAVNRIKEELS